MSPVTNYVVTLFDFTPIRRADGNPWTRARLEEADDPAGPWRVLETIDLAPLDLDPANPEPRMLTTGLATLEHGWYRVAWIDAATRESLTPPLHNVDDTLEYQPLVVRVAKLLRARTRDTDGNLLGYFGSDTTPTYEQAEELARTASETVDGAVGADIPDSLRRPAAAVTALLTAMLIELSYFPEQVATGRSPYAQYERLYTTQLEQLVADLKRLGDDELLGTPDDLSAAGMAVFYFPDLGVPIRHAEGAELPLPLHTWMVW